MPRFKIVSTDRSCQSAEVIARDQGEILQIVSKLECHEADVLQDDTYSFSVRLSPNGMWTIFHRPCEAGVG